MSFLTVVTRCYKRPEMLANNRQSLADQTSQDFEQIFIVDTVGYGVSWANKQFYRHRDEPTGDYILMLDDDDMLTNNDAIKLLKAATADKPDLVMCRFDCGSNSVLPSEAMWASQWPKITHVGTPCFITRRDIWYENIEHFGQPRAGDYNFLAEIWPDLGSIEWLDVVIGKVQRVSYGAPE